MSEQELIPEPQGRRPAEDEEQDQASQYYYAPAGRGGKVGPKEVPPASYDEPMIEGQPLPDYQSGYGERENAAYTYRQPGSNAAGGQGQRQAWPGANSGARGQYQQNNRQWNVPPWARPQHNQWSTGQIAVLVILALVIGVPLVLSLVGILLGAVFSILGLAFAAFIVIGIPLIILRAAIRRSLWRGRRGPFWMGYRPRQRGPWWW